MRSGRIGGTAVNRIVKKGKPRQRRGLTKADLVDVVYDRHGALTRDEAAAVVDAIFSKVKTSLSDGRAVRIKNFGTFELTQRAGRKGIDPSSGEPIFIPPRTGLAFRPARRLQRVVTRPAKKPPRDQR